MLITTGKVQDGTIQLEGESLPEGAIVTVLTYEGDETFELGPEQEAQLLAAIEESGPLPLELRTLKTMTWSG